MRIVEDYVFYGEDAHLYDAVNIQIRKMINNVNNKLLTVDRKALMHAKLTWEAGGKLFDYLRANDIATQEFFTNECKIDGVTLIPNRELVPWTLRYTCAYNEPEHIYDFFGREYVNQRHIFMDGILNSTKIPSIKKVIFNGPATIVIWKDNSKTIVKCQEGDTFDPEKGLAMAICKKALGTNKSKSNFNDIFKKWLPKEDSNA